MTVHVSVPLDELDHAELAKIAARENQPIENVIARFLSQRIGHERWLRAEIQKGVESAANEPLVGHDEVFGALEKRMASRPPPK